MVLRSDEAANEADVERDKRFRGNVGKAATALGTLGTASVGSALTSRILPFLNQYIPADLAIKGINKVSPRLGSFLKKGQDMGLDVNEGLNFVKEKMMPKSVTENNNRNIIQQYSPELNQFVEEEMQKGRSSLEAGAVARLNPEYKKTIEKMEKDHKTDWSSILGSVFGEGQKQMVQQQDQQMMKNESGNTDQAIMAALEKILSM